MSIFQKNSGGDVSKYLQMHQNGYQFLKHFLGVTCENTLRCTKKNVNFSKMFCLKLRAKCTKMDINF